jgi:hypothetical protein
MHIMFVRATSKQRFGDVKEPYINLDQVVTVEVGHEGNVQVRLSNGDELVVSGERATRLLAYLEKAEIS